MSKNKSFTAVYTLELLGIIRRHTAIYTGSAASGRIWGPAQAMNFFFF